MIDNVLVPDGITPVVAWRAWRLRAYMDGGGSQLQSLSQDTLWPPGEALQAKCGHPQSMHKYLTEHFVRADGSAYVIPQDLTPRCPVESCACGIYALQAPDAQLQQLSTGGGYPYDTRVLGRVALWGKVIVGANGYRAEYAYPQALYVPDEIHAEIAPRLKPYGVPVLKWSAQEVVPTCFSRDPFEQAALQLKASLAAVSATGYSFGRLTNISEPRSLRVRAAWTAASVLCAGAAIFQGENAARVLWWGATGGSDLRVALGTAAAFVCGLLGLWYLHLAQRFWHRGGRT